MAEWDAIQINSRIWLDVDGVGDSHPQMLGVKYTFAMNHGENVVLRQFSLIEL